MRTPEERIKERLDGLPRVFKALYRRAMKGRSRRAAIDAHCNMCMGWIRGGPYTCSSPECPLFPYRPGETVEKKTKGISDGLRNYQKEQKVIKP
jgi:hypothetical protein